MKEEIETIRNYSEALKLKVVSEIESGIQSVSEAGRRYSIPGTTISVWLKKYGTIQRRRQVVEVTMKDQSDKIKELEAALAEAHLKARIYEKALELASVEHGFEVKKKLLYRAIRICQEAREATITQGCKTIGVSRDAYYKNVYREKRCGKRSAKVITLTQEIRKIEPRIGCRKIHNKIIPLLRNEGVPIGRDKMFEILGAHKMLVEPKKSHIKTTYSRHSYAVAPNRIKELTPTAPNQVFVADITYIHTLQGVMYLFLVTDLFSRKIVGYDLRRNLMHHGAVRALEMALAGVADPVGIIHHSDRGSQYCCHEFLAFLSDCGMSPSMTDADHCYQNAVAERVNGILKLELYIDATFRTVTHAQCAVKNAIKIYNTVRTHFSLNLKTPQEVYAKAA